MYQSYIDKDFYRNTYPSINKFAADPQNPTTEENSELDAAIFDASRDVDQMTLQRSINFDSLDTCYQDCIKYMTAAQVDYVVSLGSDPDMESKIEVGTGARLGDFTQNSVNGIHYTKADDLRRQEKISPKALKYGRQCGLTNRGLEQIRPTTKYTFPYQIGDDCL